MFVVWGFKEEKMTIPLVQTDTCGRDNHTVLFSAAWLATRLICARLQNASKPFRFIYRPISLRVRPEVIFPGSTLYCQSRHLCSWNAALTLRGTSDSDVGIFG